MKAMDSVETAMEMLRRQECQFCKTVGRKTFWEHWAWHKPELLVARCRCGNYTEITVQVIPN